MTTKQIDYCIELAHTLTPLSLFVFVVFMIAENYCKVQSKNCIINLKFK